MDAASFSWWQLAPAAATIASAMAAGAYAAFTIRNNRQISRLKATLDLIEKAESSDYYRDLAVNFRDTFFPKNSAPAVSISDLLEPKTEQAVETRTKIIFFLNHYELLAIGFENGVLDKDFYATFMRGAVVQDWQAAKDLIHQMRDKASKDHPLPSKIYMMFEALAEEWTRETLYERSLYEAAFPPERIARIMTAYRKMPKFKRPQSVKNTSIETLV